MNKMYKRFKRTNLGRNEDMSWELEYSYSSSKLPAIALIVKKYVRFVLLDQLGYIPKVSLRKLLVKI